MIQATGLTKDAGWQLGVRRTVAAPIDVAWRELLAEVGVGALAAGEAFTTQGGIHGVVRSYRENELARLSWGDSVLQLRALPAATGTTLSIHQEGLSSSEQRARLLAHWTGLLESLGASLKK